MNVQDQQWRIMAERFVSEIMEHGYWGSTGTILSGLENRHPSVRFDPELAALQAWYQILDESSIDSVRTIVREVARLAVFQCLSVLDNKTMAEPVPGAISEYVLGITVYASHNEWMEAK